MDTFRNAQENQIRCKQCNHLESFHGEDGCTIFQLGVRAVPLYRCACVHVGTLKSAPRDDEDFTDPMPTLFSTNDNSINNLQGDNSMSFDSTGYKTESYNAYVAKLTPAAEAIANAQGYKNNKENLVENIKVHLDMIKFLPNYEAELENSLMEGLEKFDDMLRVLLKHRGF